MESVKIKLSGLVKEQMGCAKVERFSSPLFTRKLGVGITPCDYDKKEKLVEIEFEDGDRAWVNIGHFFGRVIAEAKEIVVMSDDDQFYCHLNIVNFEVLKIKRTTYWKLIFESDLPF